MDKLDFTHNGGMPITQNRLAFIQASIIQCLGALAEVGGSHAGPFVVSGCGVTRVLSSGTIYNYTMAAGFIYFGGELIKVNAVGATAIDESTNAAFLLITPTSVALPQAFYDTTTPNVQNSNSAALVSLASATAEDATHILLAHLLPFAAGYSSAGIVLAVPDTIHPWVDTGTPYFATAYKIDGNEVALCGQLTNAGLGIPGGVPLLTLPYSCWPAKKSLVIAEITLAGVASSACLEIRTNGDIYFPNGAATGSAAVSLDGVRYRLR